MTGAGFAAGQTELGQLRCELRSINGRGLVVKQRLCRDCDGLEAAIEQIIRRRIARGTVNVSIDRVDGELGVLGDVQELGRLVGQLRAAARALGLDEDLGLGDVVAFAAGLPRPPAAHQDSIPPAVAALLEAALDRLLQRRDAEGAAAAAAMLGHLDEFDRLALAAASRAPEVVAAHRERLLRRLNEHLAQQGIHLEPRDIIKEVALFADRVDVSEELQRLQAHLAEVRAVLDRGGEVGRRLEFLLQELLRETNTLGSKSPDVQLSHLVVAMKSCADKLKEQAANLE
jgi:uncharacterized protein (TIGR00255 family)